MGTSHLARLTPVLRALDNIGLDAGPLVTELAGGRVRPQSLIASAEALAAKTKITPP